MTFRGFGAGVSPASPSLLSVLLPLFSARVPLTLSKALQPFGASPLSLSLFFFPHTFSFPLHPPSSIPPGVNVIVFSSAAGLIRDALPSPLSAPWSFPVVRLKPIYLPGESLRVPPSPKLSSVQFEGTSAFPDFLEQVFCSWLRLFSLRSSPALILREGDFPRPPPKKLPAFSYSPLPVKSLPRAQCLPLHFC